MFSKVDKEIIKSLALKCTLILRHSGSHTSLIKDLTYKSNVLSDRRFLMIKEISNFLQLEKEA